MNQAQVGQQNRYVGGISNIVRMGQGQETQSVQGFGDIASMSNQKASSDVGLAVRDRLDNQSVIGATIGAGARYGLHYADSSGKS